MKSCQCLETCKSTNVEVRLEYGSFPSLTSLHLNSISGKLTLTCKWGFLRKGATVGPRALSDSINWVISRVTPLICIRHKAAWQTSGKLSCLPPHATYIVCSYYRSSSRPLRGKFLFPTGAHYILLSLFFRALQLCLHSHGSLSAFASFQLITFWQRFCSLYVLAPTVCILGNIYCLSCLPALGLLTIPWEQWEMMCQNLPASQHSLFTTRTPWAREQIDYYNLYLSG